MIGHELGDVRCTQACFAQHLGGLQRLAEEARKHARGFAQPLHAGVVAHALRVVRHQIRELGPQLVVAIPLLEAIVDLFVVGRGLVRELERALHALEIARRLPHRGELAGELGCAFGALDGEQALHQQRALARIVVRVELADDATENLAIVGRDDQRGAIDADCIGRFVLLEQVAEPRRDVDGRVAMAATLRVFEA